MRRERGWGVSEQLCTLPRNIDELDLNRSDLGQQTIEVSLATKLMFGNHRTSTWSRKLFGRNQTCCSFRALVYWQRCKTKLLAFM